MNGFQEVMQGDVCPVIQVDNGPRRFENPMIGTGAELELAH
jgi:hypothetical protein